MPSSSKNHSGTINFKEVAQYVGHQMSPGSRCRKRRPDGIGRSSSSPATLPEVGSRRSSSSGSDLFTGRRPTVPQGRADHIQRQLAWLQAEQRTEHDEVKKAELCLTHSTDAEVRAQKRSERHRDLLRVHEEKAAEVHVRIAELQQSLNSQPKARAASPAMGSSSSSWRSADPMRNTGGSWRSATSGVVPSSSATSASTSRGFGIDEGGMRSMQSTTSISEEMMRASGGLNEAKLLASGAAKTRAGFLRVAHPEEIMASTERGRRKSLQLQSKPKTYVSASMDDDEDEHVLQDNDGSGSGLSDVSDSERNLSEKRVAYIDENEQESPPDSARHDPEEENRQRIRDIIRVSLTDKMKGELPPGDPYIERMKQAFDTIDLTKSGDISFNEWNSALDRLKIRWKELSGLKTSLALFNVFDRNHSGKITMKELFPEAVDAPMLTGLSTPDFWKHYCRHTRDISAGGLGRRAHWLPKNQEEQLNLLFSLADQRKDVELTRKKMHATFWRLKGRGKSDSRCRELVALHLPRGTGPKDREGVYTLVQQDASNCKKLYSEQINSGIKSTQKEIYRLRDRGAPLLDCRRQMLTLDGVRQKPADERKEKAAAGLKGLGAVRRGSAALSADTPEVLEHVQRAAQVAGIDGRMAMELHQKFTMFCEAADHLGRKGFGKSVQALQPDGMKLEETSVDSWWKQLWSLQGREAEVDKRNAPELYCNFAQLLRWHVKNTEMTRTLSNRFRKA